jgi:hypothetical protein
MKKIKQTNTKLLVIAITAEAIIAAITTTSIGGAKPAFAALNCDSTDTTFVCSGGTNYPDQPGGEGRHFVSGPDPYQYTESGGHGGNAGTSAGGGGEHRTCNEASGCQNVGGRGGHAIPSH